jgi:hypothetical protein
MAQERNSSRQDAVSDRGQGNRLAVGMSFLEGLGRQGLHALEEANEKVPQELHYYLKELPLLWVVQGAVHGWLCYRIRRPATRSFSLAGSGEGESRVAGYGEPWPLKR